MTTIVDLDAATIARVQRQGAGYIPSLRERAAMERFRARAAALLDQGALNDALRAGLLRAVLHAANAMDDTRAWEAAGEPPPPLGGATPADALRGSLATVDGALAVWGHAGDTAGARSIAAAWGRSIAAAWAYKAGGERLAEAVGVPPLEEMMETLRQIELATAIANALRDVAATWREARDVHAPLDRLTTLLQDAMAAGATPEGVGAMLTAWCEDEGIPWTIELGRGGGPNEDSLAPASP